MIGAGVAAVAGLASKAKASLNSSESSELQERFALGQAIVCSKKDAKALIFEMKKSFFSTDFRVVIEGKFQFPHAGPRQVAIVIPHGAIDDPKKSLIATGYVKESNFIKCKEVDFVSYVHGKYPFPTLTTEAERHAEILEMVLKTQKEMELERRNKAT